MSLLSDSISFSRSTDTKGTTVRCEIPVSSSRGEAVEASDGGQVLMNTRHCLQQFTRKRVARCTDKNSENCNMRTAGLMELTDVGLQDLRDD